MTATHKGTCQICAAIQKIVKGKVAKHGYSVNWMGTKGFTKHCKGTGELPLEQDCTVLKAYIQYLNDKLVNQKSLLVSITSIMESPVENKVWRRIGEVYVEVELTEREDGYYFIDAEGMEKRFMGNGCYTLKEVVIRTRNSYKNDTNQSIGTIERLIGYKQERLDNWKPSDLIAL
jgi:hypothetical protein